MSTPVGKITLAMPSSIKLDRRYIQIPFYAPLLFKVEYTHVMPVGSRSLQDRKTIVVARIVSDFPNKACITQDHVYVL